MDLYRCNLIGLFDTIVFTWEGEAMDRFHAYRIASAVFNGVSKRGESTKIASNRHN